MFAFVFGVCLTKTWVQSCRCSFSGNQSIKNNKCIKRNHWFAPLINRKIYQFTPGSECKHNKSIIPPVAALRVPASLTAAVGGCDVWGSVALAHGSLHSLTNSTESGKLILTHTLAGKIYRGRRRFKNIIRSCRVSVSLQISFSHIHLFKKIKLLRDAQRRDFTNP